MRAKFINEEYEIQDEFEKITKLMINKNLKKDVIYYLCDFLDINDFNILKKFIKDKICIIINSRFHWSDGAVFIGPSDFEELNLPEYKEYRYTNINKTNCPIGVIELSDMVGIDHSGSIFGNQKNYSNKHFITKIDSSFIHELRHAYNDYISEGKASNNYSRESNEEISAIIAGMTNDIEWYSNNEIRPFKEILSLFQRAQGLEYNKLSADTKKRFIRKISQIWHIKKDRIKNK